MSSPYPRPPPPPTTAAHHHHHHHHHHPQPPPSAYPATPAYYHPAHSSHHHHYAPVPSVPVLAPASTSTSHHMLPAQVQVQPLPSSQMGAPTRRERIQQQGSVNTATHSGLPIDYDPSRWHPRSQKQIEIESLPSNDLAAHYVGNNTQLPGPSSPRALGLPRPTRNLPAGNRGTKLEIDGVLQRRGRMYAWSPMVVEDLYGNPYGYGDELKRKEREVELRVKKRFKAALAATLPNAAIEAGQPYQEGVDINNLPVEKKKRWSGITHLRSPSPPLRSSDVIESLSRIGTGPGANRDDHAIGTTYLDLATSPAVKYTLGVANKEKALLRTVDDLIDGESHLLGVLGRLQAAMDRIGREPSRLLEPVKPKDHRITRASTPEVAKEVDALPLNQDEEATAKVEQEPTPIIEGTEPNDKQQEETTMEIDQEKPEVATPSAAPGPSSQPPAPLAKPALDSSFLFGSGEPFFVPPGSMVSYEPIETTDQDPDIIDVYPSVDLNPLQRLFVTRTGLLTTIGPNPNDPRLHLPLTHPGYPHTTAVRLTPETQKQSVICAIEKIRELAADCHEYVYRLQEIRERLANVGRARRKVWQVVRERTVLSHDGEIGDGEADLETMRLRAEAEHAISGTQIETRRRRGVATAAVSAVTS